MVTPAENMEDEKLRRWSQEDDLARDILSEARVQLMLKFRFLDLALWRMDLEPKRDALRMPLGTTGKRVYYDTLRIFNRYTESFDELIRDYLHTVMHCVFRHPYDEGYPNADAWGLAADIIVESVIIEMIGGRFPSEDDRARLSAISELKMLVGVLVPAKLYACLRDAMAAPEGTMFRGIDTSKLASWRTLFERDSHEAWPANADETQHDNDADEDSDTQDEDDSSNGDEIPDEGKLDAQGEDAQGDAQGDSDAQSDAHGGAAQDQDDQQSKGEQGRQGADEQQGRAPQGGSDAQNSANGKEQEQEAGQANSGAGASQNQDMQNAQRIPSGRENKDNAREPDIDAQALDEREREEKEWEDIAKQIEMNLEMFAQGWGEEASNLVSSLQVANRKKYSYTDFLRSFMTINEAMKLDMDEFDYIYYTYGIDTYGNMPLVEPLEYKDTNQIRDFVIAVDTSESTRATLVKRFIEHTFDILKESENFAREINVHIIQCDSKVQSDTKISSLRQIDGIMEDFHIRGFGGTDFRPVFDYVEVLRERGDLRDMKGLIYFTDGLGRFPERAPDYECAFVFMNDGDVPLPPVPPWSIKIVLDEHAINRLKPAGVKDRSAGGARGGGRVAQDEAAEKASETNNLSPQNQPK